MADLEKELTTEIITILDREEQVAKIEAELQLNPKFKEFLDLKKQVDQQVSSVWKMIEERMIENDIKQLKGDFGTVTIAERQGWDIDETELPSKFYKKVVDTTKLTATYRLEGKAPKGCTPKITKYITKRLK